MLLKHIWRIEKERRRLQRDTSEYTPPEYGAGSRGTTPATTGDAVSKSATPMLKGLVLRWFAKGKSALELGTGFGLGAAYIASSAKRLDTIDAEWRLSRDTNLYIGTQWGMKFDHALREFSRLSKRFNFVHIDGDHRGTALTRYFEELMPLMLADSVIIMDDVIWSEDMHRGYLKCCTNENVKRHLRIHDLGIIWLK